MTRNHIRRHVTTNALRPKTGSVRPFGPAIAAAWLLALGIALAPREAGAFDLHGGVSLGGVLAGTVPRFAISPHLGVGWRTESGLFFEAHDMASILPLGNLGIYNQTSAALGYASDKASFSAGPTLAIYSMPACGAVLCGSVAGFSPGGHAAASYYVAGPFGVAVHVHAAWIGGNSLVLPGGVAVMAVLGPVVRWRSE